MCEEKGLGKVGGSADKLVDKWHESDTDMTIFEYMGLTEEQYCHWVATNQLPEGYVLPERD